MAIVTISRGSFSRGKTVAEKLAKKLGYECLGREVIVKASEESNITVGKLSRALHDSPSVMERFTYSKEKYIAYIQQAFLNHIKNDNIVYHGLAGHFFLKNAPNVLKVRIIANMQDRIEEEMSRENISETDAKKLLIKDDNERRSWSQHLYGVDTTSPGLYDLVVHIDKLGVDDAVELIASTLQLPCFQSNDQTRAYIQDLYIAAKAQALLIENHPTVYVTCKNGVVRVCFKGSPGNEQKLDRSVEDLILETDGVKKIESAVEPILVAD